MNPTTIIAGGIALNKAVVELRIATIDADGASITESCIASKGRASCFYAASRQQQSTAIRRSPPILQSASFDSQSSGFYSELAMQRESVQDDQRSSGTHGQKARSIESAQNGSTVAEEPHLTCFRMSIEEHRAQIVLAWIEREYENATVGSWVVPLAVEVAACKRAHIINNSNGWCRRWR